jgi:hypothetical protein
MTASGYSVFDCSGFPFSPPVKREFQDVLHIANLIYLNPSDNIFNVWHEAGHAIIADTNYAMGINWEPIITCEFNNFTYFSRDDKESLASIACVYMADLHGMDFVDGLAGYQYIEYEYNQWKKNGKPMCPIYERVLYIHKCIDNHIVHEYPMDRWQLGTDIAKYHEVHPKSYGRKITKSKINKIV